jgi:hypothetical protein
MFSMNWDVQGFGIYALWLLATVVLPAVAIFVTTDKNRLPGVADVERERFKRTKTAMIVLLATSAPLNLVLLGFVGGSGMSMSGAYGLLIFGFFAAIVSVIGALSALLLALVKSKPQTQNGDMHEGPASESDAQASL